MGGGGATALLVVVVLVIIVIVVAVLKFGNRKGRSPSMSSQPNPSVGGASDHEPHSLPTLELCRSLRRSVHYSVIRSERGGVHETTYTTAEKDEAESAQKDYDYSYIDDDEVIQYSAGDVTCDPPSSAIVLSSNMAYGISNIDIKTEHNYTNTVINVDINDAADDTDTDANADTDTDAAAAEDDTDTDAAAEDDADQGQIYDNLELPMAQLFAADTTCDSPSNAIVLSYNMAYGVGSSPAESPDMDPAMMIACDNDYDDIDHRESHSYVNTVTVNCGYVNTTPGHNDTTGL